MTKNDVTQAQAEGALPPTNPSNASESQADPETLNSALHDMFARLLSDAEAKDAQAYHALADSPGLRSGVAAVRARDPLEFEMAVKWPFKHLCDGLLRAEIQETERSSKARFLFTEIEFVRCNFRFVIEQREGYACVVDKTNYLLRALARNLIDKQPIQFNYDQKYTYHLPKSVFTTEAQIMDFFQGLYYLHAGRPAKYLEVLPQLLVAPKHEAAAADEETNQAPQS
jgi:hypothetical protein